MVSHLVGQKITAMEGFFSVNSCLMIFLSSSWMWGEKKENNCNIILGVWQVLSYARQLEKKKIRGKEWDTFWIEKSSRYSHFPPRVLKKKFLLNLTLPSCCCSINFQDCSNTFICSPVEPSDKSVEIMRKFSEQYARKSGTYFCVDKGVTSVVIKVLLFYLVICLPYLDSNNLC